MKNNIILVLFVCLLASCMQNKTQKEQIADPLPSWNDGTSKTTIIGYVRDVTNKESANYIPVEDRIAAFDNDGTLWCEQPMYIEMAYSLDMAKTIIADKPELAKKKELQDLVNKELFAKNPEKAILEAFALSHTGMSTDEFANNSIAWLDTAMNKHFKAKYTSLIYQPMVELLQYLRDNEFKTYIVSGGSSAFIRQVSQQLYGIPAEQVIGTMFKAEFVSKDGSYQVMYTPELWHNDDNVGKPVGIEQIIGKRPVLAFGNSDGDLQMLQWTTTNASYQYLCLLLHHTDGEREFAYDSLSSIGTLKNALIEANRKDWTVVDMKNDFKTVFSFQK